MKKTRKTHILAHGYIVNEINENESVPFFCNNNNNNK